MSLPPYLYIMPQGGITDAGTLLSTEHPFIYGSVHLFKREEEMNAFKAKFLDENIAQVEGFWITVNYVGNLSRIYPKPELIKYHLDLMCKYYSFYKIEKRLYHYKKHRDK